MNAWVYVIVGAIFATCGTVSIGYGWYKMRKEKSSPTDSTNSIQVSQNNSQSVQINIENNIETPAQSGERFQHNISKFFHVDVSPLRNGNNRYIEIRNVTETAQYNVHIVISADRKIVATGPPWPEGGGLLQTNYIRNEGKLYETEIAIIPPMKMIKIVFVSEEGAFVPSVTIY